MLKKLGLNNARESLLWDAFVESHPEATPFHQSGWIKTLVEAYHFESLLYVLEDKAGTIKAIAPFIRKKALMGGSRIVSLPFSDFCSPLGVARVDAIQLLNGIIQDPLLVPVRIEIRGIPASTADFIVNNYYKHHILRLRTDPYEVLRGVDKRTILYNIRRARRAGVEIITDNTSHGVEEFLRLNISTRRKHGIPSPPKCFYEAFARNLIDKGKASIMLAVHKSRVRAAGVFITHRKTVFYKYNASEQDPSTSQGDNHLLTWTAIEKACLEGCEIFDFGRTAPDNLGLMRYKKMWGAESFELPYYYYRPRRMSPFIKSEYGSLQNMAKRIWRILPESFVAWLGPKIMKHLG